MSPPETPPGQDNPVAIELDGTPREAPRRRLSGREIRQLGDPNRVDGFETQEINAQGKKVRTIRDDETVQLHPNHRFRTIPNEGGPGDGPPTLLVEQVKDLSQKTGYTFSISQNPVPGTRLYLVWTDDLALPDRYTLSTATFGFRIPENFPDAAPEDQFFLRPATVKLRQPDEVRKSTDIHRASVSNGILGNRLPGDQNVLVFSWHIWDRRPWNRSKHTLHDHFGHCIRRLDTAPEHD